MQMASMHGFISYSYPFMKLIEGLLRFQKRTSCMSFHTRLLLGMWISTIQKLKK